MKKTKGAMKGPGFRSSADGIASKGKTNPKHVSAALARGGKVKGC